MSETTRFRSAIKSFVRPGKSSSVDIRRAISRRAVGLPATTALPATTVATEPIDAGARNLFASQIRALIALSHSGFSNGTRNQTSDGRSNKQRFLSPVHNFSRLIYAAILLLRPLAEHPKTSSSEELIKQVNGPCPEWAHIKI